MAEAEHTPKWAWDRQWRGHLLSTFCHHADPKTGKAIVEGWESFFTGLPGNARILDIGTGNGFIPLIARGVSGRGGNDYEIHGADYARIDPAAALPEQAAVFKTITFHPETPAEALPFEDAYFDAATAQHALEYCDSLKALGEIARVLKPGGGARFLLHASTGEIIRANTPKIKQCRYLLEENKVFDIAEAAILSALKGQGDDGAALKGALKAATGRFGGDANTFDMMELLNLLWGAYEARDNFPDAAAVSAWLSENRKETEAQMLRIEAMQGAALSKDEAEKLTAQMTILGFEDVTLSLLEAAGTKALIGWLIVARKK